MAEDRVGGCAGLSGSGTAGGVDEPEACFGGTALAFCVGCTAAGVIGTIEIAEVPADGAVGLRETWCVVFSPAGA
jgi:hypothetical protein